MLTGFRERFLTSCKARGLVKRTLDWYETQIGVYLDWLEDHSDMRWDDVETVERYMAEQRDLHLKDNTIHARYRSLSAWFNWLVKRKYISESPMDGISPPSVDQEPIEPMTLDEYEKLIGTTRGEDRTWLDKRDHFLFYLLFWCGLRISEACSLRIHDINVVDKVITIQRRKGGDGGFVPCGDDLGPIMLDYLISRPPSDSENLFLGCNGSGGIKGLFTPSGARQMMTRRCRSARIRKMSPHKGRHGFATELLNAGLDLAKVADMMGHTTPETTRKKYAKYRTKTLVHDYNEVRDRMLAERRH